MKSFNLMLKIELVQLKNYIKGILKTPKRWLPRLAYVILMVFIVWSNLSGASTFDTPEARENLMTYVSGGALLLMMFMGYALLNKSSVFFKSAEVNMLFTAPINPRKILLFNLLKKIPIYLMTSIFTMVFAMIMIIGAFKPGFDQIILAFLGYTLVLLILEPLGFIFFLIASKLRKEELRKKLIKVTFGLLTLFASIFITQSVMANGLTLKNVFMGLSRPELDLLPIMGWGRSLVMAIASGISTSTYIYLGLLLITYVGLVTLTYILGTDYYEEVIVTSEEREELMKRAKAGRVSYDQFSLKKKNVKIDKVHPKGTVFHWKRKLILKRKDISIFVSIESLLCIVIVVLLKVFSSGDIRNFGVFMATGMYFYVKFLFSSNTHLDQELRKPFFYLIPDTPMRKIVSLVQVDLMRFFINITLMVVTHFIMFRHMELSFILLPMMATLFYSLMVFSSILFKVFFPANDVNKMFILFKFLQIFLLALPAFIIMLIVGTITESVAAAFVGSIIINTLVNVILLSLSEVLFNKLELR